MPEHFFIELSLLVVTAVLIIGIIRLLKQPLIIGYIITGILASPSIFNFAKSTDVLTTFSEIGVVLLLFMVGLHLNPKIIKDVGKVSLITGLGQVIFTSIIGFFLARWLGFDLITALYLAIALTFSSTIIITKLLSDKGSLQKLHGKIAIGFLIVQDIIAILVLIVISSLSSGNNITNLVTQALLVGSSTIIGLFIFSYYALPPITKRIAKNQEFLLLFSLGWAFAISTLFAVLNFSIEIGALLAGITLSLSPYRFEITSKLKPLRDFFIFMFFIWLGSQMTFENIPANIPAIAAFSTFILLGNPFIVIVLMSLLKYKKQTNFLAGLTVAQISEFSLIIVALGVKIGHISSEILSLVTMVGLITIAGSTYFIMYSHKIYPYVSPHLAKLEREDTNDEEEEIKSKKYEVILFGAHRTGSDIIEAFKNKKSSLLIVDFDPEIIEALSKRGYNTVYGDMSDIELLNDIDICDAKLLISTIPDLESNSLFMRRAKLCNRKGIVMGIATQISEALDLYKSGADYVIIPQILGGKYASKLIEKNKLHSKNYKSLGKKHVKELLKIQDNQKNGNP